MIQFKYIFLVVIVFSLNACNNQVQTKYQENHKELLASKNVEIEKYTDWNVVTNGYLDNSGNMWFTTLREGVFRYDGNTFKNYTIKDGLCSNKVNVVIQAQDGLLWFGTSEGLCSYNGDKFVNFPLPKKHVPEVSPETGFPSRISREVLSLIQDKKGIFWIGTISDGAYRFDGKTFTSFLRFEGRVHPDDNVYNNCIQSIVEDNDGNIWFTSQTHGGITRYDGQKMTNFTKEDGLPDDMIFSSFKDSDGVLWFGTLDKGLISYNEGTFKYYNENDGLNNNMVSCFHQSKSGKLWIGSFRESTVTWFDGTSFTSLPFDIDEKLVELRFIAEDKDGSVWFGGRYGLLWRYDGTELKDFTYLKRNN